MTVENLGLSPVPISEEFSSDPILETQRRLFCGLLNCGLSFHNAVEKLGLYSTEQRVQDIGEMGVKSDIYSGMWSFGVLSSRLPDFPDGERSYSRCVEWAFGLETKKEGRVWPRSIVKLNENHFVVKLFDFESEIDYSEFEKIGVNWRMVLQKKIKTEQPLGEIQGKLVDYIREEIKLGGNLSGRFNPLTVERTLGLPYPFSFGAVLGYNEGNQRGFLIPTCVSGHWERHLTIGETPSADDFLSEEIIEIQRGLLASFPASIDAIGLMETNFELIVDATGRAVEDLRMELDLIRLRDIL